VHWRHDPERPDELSIWMPCVPHTLRELLDSSAFSPHSPPWSAPNPPSPEDFAAVTQSLAFQLVSAVAFLHAPAQGIAHRDVKPANILLAPSGCAKLADFGVAYDLLAPGPDTDVWPEAADALYTQVATGYGSPAHAARCAR
jgi:serine/threonine protein kinase